MTDLKDMDLWDQPDEGDPLVWLRKHRDEIAEKYPTIEELSAYLRSTPPREEIMADLQRKIEEKRRKGYKSTDLYIEQDD